MFEENYRREMQAALPSAAATDALERRMDALRRRPKRPPVREVAVVLLALLLLAVPLLPALLQPQTQGYEALLAKLEGMSGYRALSPNDFLFSSDSVMEVEPPASEEPSDGAESGNAAYSETNNQVAGVQEPDTVKTDGRFLYSLSAGENVLHITRADNGVLSAAASIDPVGDSAVVAEIRERLREFADGTAGRRDASFFRCTEFLLGGNRLTLLLTVPAQWYLSLLPDLPDYGYYNILGHSTLAMVYDVADPTAPALVNEFLLSGSYGTARQIGGQVFVMTGERAVRSENVYELLPSCRAGGKMLYPSGGDICIAADAATPYFTSVSVLDTSGRSRCTDIKTFLGFSSQLYMNAESLYLSGARYDGSAKTQLVRFSRTGDGLEFAAEGCVPGSLLNQFSMDEYDGVLRVAVTETGRNGESTNSLYTLRQEGGALVVAGALTGMGITERIYGVRFFGETGYIVTFRQTDPLYTLDLSDPERPRLCSELKITGYSAYLHVYGAGRLFGFGNEATQDGSVQSLKLTMFDTADPSAVRTENALVLDELAPVWQASHKMLLVDPARKLIGFPASEWNGGNVYMLYTYDETTGFSERARIALPPYTGLSARGLYIGDCYYIVSPTEITPLSLTDFRLLEPFVLS